MRRTSCVVAAGVTFLVAAPARAADVEPVALRYEGSGACPSETELVVRVRAITRRWALAEEGSPAVRSTPLPSNARGSRHVALAPPARDRGRSAPARDGLHRSAAAPRVRRRHTDQRGACHSGYARSRGEDPLRWRLAGWQLMKALAIAERYGYRRYVAHQAYYSLVGRDYEWSSCRWVSTRTSARSCGARSAGVGSPARSAAESRCPRSEHHELHLPLREHAREDAQAEVEWVRGAESVQPYR